jgi:hypothetical protein
MMKQKTAVEWLVERLAENGILHSSDINQAKQMEQLEKLKHQLFIGKVSDEIGFNKTVELLKEVNQAFNT